MKRERRKGEEGAINFYNFLRSPQTPNEWRNIPYTNFFANGSRTVYVFFRFSLPMGLGQNNKQKIEDINFAQKKLFSFLGRFSSKSSNLRIKELAGWFLSANDLCWGLNGYWTKLKWKIFQIFLRMCLMNIFSIFYRIFKQGSPIVLSGKLLIRRIAVQIPVALSLF